MNQKPKFKFGSTLRDKKSGSVFVVRLIQQILPGSTFVYAPNSDFDAIPEDNLEEVLEPMRVEFTDVVREGYKPYCASGIVNNISLYRLIGKKVKVTVEEIVK